MSRKNLSRRKFINGIIRGGIGISSLGVMGTTGCALVDNLMIGDPYRIENGVLIIGAGLSGLSAAYTLKKAQIPFRVLEASSRVGGRIYTMNYFNKENQYIELGAEFFQSKDQAVFNLCHELQLMTDEISIGENERVTLMKGKAISKLEIKKNNERFKKAFLRIYQNKTNAEIDSMSVAEFLKSFRNELDPDFLSLIDLAAVNRYGVESSNLSALMFIKGIENEGSKVQKIYRVHGGNQELIKTLYHRVSGVIPDLQVQVDSPVVAIKRKSNGFETYVKSGLGTRAFFSSKVIFAIPVRQLQNIEGIDKLELDPLQLEFYKSIKMGTHTKWSVSHEQKTMKENFSVFGDIDFQNSWLSHRGQEGNSSIVTALIGGERAKKISPQDLVKFLNYLNQHQGTHFNPINVDSHIKMWDRAEWINGSFSYYEPGQYLKFQESLNQDYSSGGVYFAGDYNHGPALMGMNTAIQSGIHAALKIIEKIS